MAQFQPKNALRRAREFMKVGRVQDACEVLHNAISKRGRTVVWTPDHEEMMIEFINLAVELRDPRRAKDGMYHYRQLSQLQGEQSGVSVKRVSAATRAAAWFAARAAAWDAGAAAEAAAWDAQREKFLEIVGKETP